MKHSDITRLHELGLITEEQRQRIIATLRLKEDGGKLVLVFSIIGALLVLAGIILLISANWEAIPRLWKIASGIGLMAAAWAGGWFLREAQGLYRKAGEGLYLIGAGLWLANIALIGQIYHLSSRPSNAFLLWFVGIAALPWLLRAKGLFVLMLIALGIWLGVEVNEVDGWFGPPWGEAQLVLYSLCGLVLVGWGGTLRASRWDDFAAPAQKFGLLGLLLAAYPLCWKEFTHGRWVGSFAAVGLLVSLSVVAAGLLVFGLRRHDLDLDRQWRWTWGLTLAGIGGLLWIWLIAGDGGSRSWDSVSGHVGTHWLMIIGLFVASLLQVQVGVALQSRFMVNLAVTMIALLILAAYVTLFGSMATTGLMFVFSGIFLIVFGIYLERKRRKLISRIRTSPAALSQPANGFSP